jgi:PAB1-binding protein PBP1
MTNSVVSRLAGLNTTVLRLNEAVATASADYGGVPGTEFESGSMGGMGPYAPNNFGVQPDPASPGVNGTNYADAVGQLATQWAAFWALAAPYIKTLDNGQAAM